MMPTANLMVMILSLSTSSGVLDSDVYDDHRSDDEILSGKSRAPKPTWSFYQSRQRTSYGNYSMMIRAAEPVPAYLLVGIFASIDNIGFAENRGNYYPKLVMNLQHLPRKRFVYLPDQLPRRKLFVCMGHLDDGVRWILPAESGVSAIDGWRYLEGDAASPRRLGNGFQKSSSSIISPKGSRDTWKGWIKVYPVISNSSGQ